MSFLTLPATLLRKVREKVGADELAIEEFIIEAIELKIKLSSSEKVAIYKELSDKYLSEI